jgi:hypothetical protein
MKDGALSKKAINPRASGEETSQDLAISALIAITMDEEKSQ